MEKNIESHLIEKRVFKPAEVFAKKARIGSLDAIPEDVSRIDQVAGEILGAGSARTGLVQAVEESAGMESAVREMVRRRKTQRLGQLPRSASQPALPQQGRDHLGRRTRDDKRTLTYQQLHREVCRFANVLKRNGIKKGDRVIIYMPMVPEAAIAMLACARIGAVHSVVFGGFSAAIGRGSHFRLPGEAGHHRRWRLSARRGRSAEEKCR